MPDELLQRLHGALESPVFDAQAQGRNFSVAMTDATAALLAGADGVLDHLDRHGLVGLAVAADGHVLASPGLSGLATPAGVR